MLGHESGRVTTHYSSAEVLNLVAAANAITESRKSPTRTMLRLISPVSLIDFIVKSGGAEGDRTLDLRSANATLSQLSYRPTQGARF